MTFNEAKTELAAYCDDEKLVKNGFDKIRELRSKANKLVATYVLQEGGFSAGNGDRLTKYAVEAAQELDDMGETLLAISAKNAVIRETVLKKMYGRYRRVLADYYLYDLEAKDIAEDMNIDLKHFYREKDRAVAVYAGLRSKKKTGE